MQNYFELLDIPVSFSIDEQELHRAYVARQREFHPDRQTGKGDVEKQKAILASMEINTAYQTLKNPVTRAQHLLALKDVRVGNDSKGDSYQPEPALLMQVMEQREALEQATDEAAFDRLSLQARQDFEASGAAFQAAYAANELDKAAQLAIRMRYLEKFQEELRIHKSQKLKDVS